PGLSVSVGSLTRSFSGYDPFAALELPIPIGTDVSVSWSGAPGTSGAAIASYRYALDIDDPNADQPRVTKPAGFTWTLADARATFALIPGYTDAGSHTLFIEVTDESGARTLGQVHLQVISASFDRPILYILDDPNMVRTTSPSKPNMTVEENLAFWKDVL